MEQRLSFPRPAHARPAARDITKQQVSPPRRALIELGQDINHGWIENLPIRGGEPVLKPLPDIEREITFRRENGPRSELARQDFALKAQVVELFEFFDQRRDCVIKRLEFKHGLPYRMVVKESAA
jgi:hypothetical protein